MNKMVAIITGVTGQDGAYLSKLLSGRGYKVIGLVRNLEQADLSGLSYLGIKDKVQILPCNLNDLSQVVKLLEKEEPDEIYNLAAQSSVFQSFQQPFETISFNTISVLNLLEAIKLVNKKIRFYQASSSEMFGSIKHLPITEDTQFHPTSPYGVSKAAAHMLCTNYRESYGLFICCGILFNHESYLRKKNFFFKKIISEALEIKAGKRDCLQVGNLDIQRDFGFAPKYVEAMYLMMQKSEPSNYLICTGTSTSLKYIVEYVLERVGVGASKLVISRELYRPAEIHDIYGSPEKAKKELGWDYDISIEQLLDLLIEEEISNQKGFVNGNDPGNNSSSKFSIDQYVRESAPN